MEEVFFSFDLCFITEVISNKNHLADSVAYCTKEEATLGVK